MIDFFKNFGKFAGGLFAAFFFLYSLSATLALVYFLDKCGTAGVF